MAPIFRTAKENPFVCYFSKPIKHKFYILSRVIIYYFFFLEQPHFLLYLQMSPEKESFHVVIRIPCTRPKGFIEPPSVKLLDTQIQTLY